MEFALAGQYFYRQYRYDLCRLFIDSSPANPSFQFVDEDTVLQFSSPVFEHGFGVFALRDKRLYGALLALPFLFDSTGMQAISSKYPIKNSFYIAGLMVHEMFRGQGIAQKLLLKFLDEINTNEYAYVFTRVWEENKASMQLYCEMGFLPVVNIVQKIAKPGSSGVQIYREKYLVRELKPHE